MTVDPFRRARAVHLDAERVGDGQFLVTSGDDEVADQREADFFGRVPAS